MLKVENKINNIYSNEFILCPSMKPKDINKVSKALTNVKDRAALVSSSTSKDPWNKLVCGTHTRSKKKVNDSASTASLPARIDVLPPPRRSKNKRAPGEAKHNEYKSIITVAITRKVSGKTSLK